MNAMAWRYKSDLDCSTRNLPRASSRRMTWDRGMPWLQFLLFLSKSSVIQAVTHLLRQTPFLIVLHHQPKKMEYAHASRDRPFLCIESIRNLHGLRVVQLWFKQHSLIFDLHFLNFHPEKHDLVAADYEGVAVVVHEHPLHDVA